MQISKTGDGSLFYPVQGRDVDMDYKTYPFVYDNKIRQAVAVALYALITTLVLISFGLYNCCGRPALVGAYYVYI